jgi:uncharacterized protein (TIGR02145 family)/uncharacterized repeat protein (TIGR02543 family)
LSPVSGGTVSRKPSKTAYKAGDTVTVTATAYDGYRFVSWTGDDTSTDTAITIVITNTNLELTANFEQTATPPENARTITFNANGGTVNPTSGTTGSDGKLASLPTPTRSGYTFDGWYTAATGGTEVTTSMTFSANTTIYAQWVAEPITPPQTPTYTITFNYNYTGVSNTTGTTGADGKLASLPTPTRSGYIFDGWFTASEGGTEVTVNRVYTANTTIYAQWTAEPVTPPLGSTFTDSRDSKSYKKVTIGGMTWMAENLNYDVPDNTTDVCYENSADSCAKYGRLYNWSTAMAACPVGWRLPSDAEWMALTDADGGSSTAGTKLKARDGWYNNGNGTDDYGFAALPGGGGNSDGGFSYASNYGYWWSSTEYDAERAWYRRMFYGFELVYRDGLDKTYLFSVRCVED